MRGAPLAVCEGVCTGVVCVGLCGLWLNCNVPQIYIAMVVRL